MKIRKKTMALLLFSTAFICTVGVSALVLWQTDVLNLPSGQPVEPTVTENPQPVSLLYPALNEDGLWGYIDDKGKMALPAVYQEALPFTGKAAWVKQNGFWGAIDFEGNFVVPAEYESISTQTHNGSSFVAAYNALSSPVYPEPNTALFDPNGAKLFGVSGRLGELCDGLMAFSRQRGEQVSWGYINPHGEIVIEPVYAEVGQVSGNFALVRDFEGKVLLLNIHAKSAAEVPELAGNTLESAQDLNLIGSRLILVQQDGKYGYVSVSGGVVITYAFDWARPFQGGAALVGQGELTELLAPDGTVLVPAKNYAAAEYLGAGLYAFKEQGGAAWQIYNAQGELAVEEPVFGFGQWQNGLCSFWTADYTGFFNAEGQVQPGLRLDLQPGVFRLGHLYGVKDVNGQTWFDEHGHTVWSVGRDRELLPGVNLLTVLENRDVNYLVYYPQVELSNRATDEDVAVWGRLNRALEDNALGEYYDSYMLRDELQFRVSGDFAIVSSGAVFSVVQTLRLDDSWQSYQTANNGQEKQVHTVCFDKDSGQLYNLSDLFKPGVNWRVELLEPARGTYSVSQAGQGLPENPEVLDFLERRLPRTMEFSLSWSTLTLYIPLSDGSCQPLEIYYQDIEELIDMEGELWQRMRTVDSLNNLPESR